MRAQDMDVSAVDAPVSLDMSLPGSKSLSVRMLLLAALADGPSRLTGLLPGADTIATLRVLRALGSDVRIEPRGGLDTVTVRGVAGQWSVLGGELDVGESATLARMLTAILSAGSQGGDWVLAGGPGLSRRSLSTLFETLRTVGGRIEPLLGPGQLPARVGGDTSLYPWLTVRATHTSQDVSAAMMGAVASGRTTVIRVVDRRVHLGYVRMTIDALASFGHVVDVLGPDGYVVRPATNAAGRNLAIEPDVSTAAYPAALAALTGGRARIGGFPVDSSQPDAQFLSVLERMGCSLTREGDAVVVVGPLALQGGFRIRMNGMADQVPTLVALAVFADSPIEICDVARVRGHESDRLVSLGAGLAAMGVESVVLDDGIRVVPGRPIRATVDPRHDHRVAMALALIGAAGDGVRIRHPGCVTKSFPGFFGMLTAAGAVVSTVGEDTVRAAKEDLCQQP